MLVVLVSAKGSPGVTTVALGLAAGWPAGEALLVEADPAGGDLAARFGVSHEPGLTMMAATTRRSAPVPELVGKAYWQRLPCGVPAALAPPGTVAGASLATLASDGPSLPERLAGYGAVVVDAGRWQPSPPVDQLLAAADVVLLVARPEAGQLSQCHARLAQLRALTVDLRLVVAGPIQRSTAGAFARELQLPLVGMVPRDRRGAAMLAGQAPAAGWRDQAWARLPLPRACRAIANRLCADRRGASEPVHVSGSGKGRRRRWPARAAEVGSAHPGTGRLLPVVVGAY